MLSENIKNLRFKKGMTQKELAEQLYVTPQAVSRWENGEVEPSIDTITMMAKIFGVTTDEIIGGPDKKPASQTVVKTEYVVKEQRPVLAVCEQCNKPIYNSADIVRHHHSGGRGSSGYTTILCKSCDEKNKKRAHEQAVANGLLQRKRSFLWGGLLTVLAVLIALIVTSSIAEFPTVAAVGTYVAAVLFFPFLSCLFLQNNFIEDVFSWISSWSIRMPGLIFSLDLEGIVWLLTVKLALWILGGLISIFCFLLAIAVCLALSVFVYPFALAKNIKHPELTDVI